MTDSNSLNTLHYFNYDHLPERLQKISRPFYDIAHFMAQSLPPSHEKDKCLDALLAAKDSAVRSLV